MNVSVIGTGRMGQGLVKVISPVIKQVQWASRTPERALQLIKDHQYENVCAVDYETALAGHILIHSFWFRDVMPWAKENKDLLAGKILVDIANPFTPDFNDFTTEWGTSAAEELQRLLPQTKVVGAFKNTFFKVLEEPVHQGLVSDVYVTSDDEEAKLSVIKLLQGIPFRVLDGGALINNRTIERMTLFEREVSLRSGNYPYVSFRMFGLNDE